MNEADIDFSNLSALIENIRIWIETDILILAKLVRAVVALALLIPAYLVAPYLRRRLDALAERPRMEQGLKGAVQNLARLAPIAIWAVLLWLAVQVAAEAGYRNRILAVVATLMSAWVIIRFMSSLVRDPAMSRLVAFAAWAIAALSILGLLEPTSNILDRIALDMSGVHISLLTVLKGLVALVALLWLANILSHFLDRRYRALDALTPSIRVLASKVTKILLITFAILAALSIVGIDLTAFAVFSGAVGVGVGFGLQKVVSNLISGVILLLDRSIKPGDVVGVDDTYGWIKDLNARYVSVVTRDGIEHLIPNEDLITRKVANWSYSNLQVRLKIPVGISYNSDVRKAIELCLEAAAAVERVIVEPRTVCLVKGFGDSSVDLEIRIWIQDPQNGISNVKSQVLLGVWDRFHEHGIEIPFPQRDIHLRSSIPVEVASAGSDKT